MNYEDLFSNIHQELLKQPDTGEVASYIPELGKVNPKKFGIHLTTVDCEHFSYGDSEEKFSIQSIAKVLSLILASKYSDGKLFGRVGVEPSGNPFNSLIQLETDLGVPRNPFINAGALVIADFLVSNLKDPCTEFLAFVRKIGHNQDINYSSKIADSEKEKGYRNAALVNFMKSFGNIESDVEEVLDFYFKLCSLEMTCRELSRTFLFLATDGTDPSTKEEIITTSTSKRVNAIMQLCGFYDEAGEFSYRVGLPGKSGVGGGIAAILPDKYSIAVWSPKLNLKGNSNFGLKFLEQFTTETEASIF